MVASVDVSYSTPEGDQEHQEGEDSVHLLPHSVSLLAPANRETRCSPAYIGSYDFEDALDASA